MCFQKVSVFNQRRCFLKIFSGQETPSFDRMIHGVMVLVDGMSYQREMAWISHPRTNPLVLEAGGHMMVS